MWILSKTDCHILQAECPKLFDGKTSHWMVGYGWNRMESAWDNGSVSKTSNQAQIPQPIRRWRTSIAGLACWCAISQPPEQSSGPGDRFRRLVPGYQHKGFHRFSRFLSFLVCLIIPSISSSAKSLEATTALRTSDFIRPLASPPTPDSQMRLRQSTTSQGRLPLTMSDHVWPCLTMSSQSQVPTTWRNLACSFFFNSSCTKIHQAWGACHPVFPCGFPCHHG